MKLTYRHFYNRVPDKYREEFRRAIFYRHLDRILLISGFFFITEFMVYTVLLVVFKINKPLFLLVSAVMLVFALLSSYARKIKPVNVTILLSVLEKLYLAALLIFCIIVTYQGEYVSFITSFIGVLGVLTVFYLEPTTSLSILLLSDLIIISLLFYSNNNLILILHNSATILVLSVIAWFASVTIFKGFVLDFLSNKELQEKNDELIKTRQFVEGGKNEQLTTSGFGVNESIKKAIDFLWEHYNCKFSLQDAAKAANLSKFHFIRVFKTETGKTPHEYFIDIKLEKARQLLKYSKKNMTEICDICGFSDSSQFTSVFKSRHSITPSEYRKLYMD